ncbi:MAG: ATP-binding protein [Gammaproteobacteria bacterium]|nr:ATP-binding protein [Gammaproteobacteria bacterium]
MFEDGIHGTLMKIKRSNQTSLGFTVWFPFVRSHMKMIRDGSLVAVRNFSSSKDYDNWSIMRITSVMPAHYALMASQDGYPGFVEEAAMSASKDWDQDRPVEDTTKIVCEAVPSGFEIKIPVSMDDREPVIHAESNLPMQGERAKLLDTEWTGRIINHDLQTKDGTVVVGTLANMEDVEILALWDSMIRTHFGVFAYTNAGKSNLLSTITSKVFESSNRVKAVIYDLMGEYGILLLDVLYGNDNANIVFISHEETSAAVRNFWSEPTEENARTAAKDIVDTTVFPKMLIGRKKDFILPVQKILMDGKFKILSNKHSVIGDLFRSLKHGTSAAEQDVMSILDQYKKFACNVENLNNLLTELDEHDFEQTSKKKGQDLKNKAKKILAKNIQDLSNISIDPKFKISLDKIVEDLNQSSRSSLYIMQGHNDENVRRFSQELGEMMLYSRRERGIISPPVSFIYDEADQFIAQDDKQPGMKDSKQIAEQLARRGRKYGLGIGIATQRIVYLDTNILGQPHTYFVSKLPRASDREKIQEAFGLSDETLQESLRFALGQWLLISHGATGIDGLPIPVQLPDANERIKDFLNRLPAEDGA